MKLCILLEFHFEVINFTANFSDWILPTEGCCDKVYSINFFGLSPSKVLTSVWSLVMWNIYPPTVIFHNETRDKPNVYHEDSSI